MNTIVIFKYIAGSLHNRFDVEVMTDPTNAEEKYFSLCQERTKEDTILVINSESPLVPNAEFHLQSGDMTNFNRENNEIRKHSIWGTTEHSRYDLKKDWESPTPYQIKALINRIPLDQDTDEVSISFNDLGQETNSQRVKSLFYKNRDKPMPFLVFRTILEFAGFPEASGEIYNYEKSIGMEKPEVLTHITGFYSLFPKRVDTPPENQLMIRREFEIENTDTISIYIAAAAIERTIIDNEGNEHNEIYISDDGHKCLRSDDKYPSTTEDIVENGLIYMALNGMSDLHTNENNISVHFTTLGLIRTIKNTMGIELSHSDIVTALKILVLSTFDLRIKSTEGIGVRSLSRRIVNLTNHQTINSPLLYSCELHKILSKEIKHGNLRKHDIRLESSIDSSYGRDLYRQMTWSNQHTNDKNFISIDAKKSLENSSCGFSTTNMAKNWGTLSQGLDELVKLNIIVSWKTIDSAASNNKTVHIWPSVRFNELQRNVPLNQNTHSLISFFQVHHR